MFRTHASRINVVLLDVTLPGLSGPEIFAALRELRPDVQVVLTTAYARAQALEKVGAGASCLYIRKPYQLAELAELLQTACQRQTRTQTNN